MEGRNILKAGKLLKVWLAYDSGKIKQVKITGDFFLYPEETIADLENGLSECVLNEQAISERVNKLLKDVEVFGFTPQDLAKAIMGCVHG